MGLALSLVTQHSADTVSCQTRTTSNKDSAGRLKGGLGLHLAVSRLWRKTLLRVVLLGRAQRKLSVQKCLSLQACGLAHSTASNFSVRMTQKSITGRWA